MTVPAVPLVGTLIIALMLWQHWAVAKKKETQNWDNLLVFYRRMMLLAVFGPILFVFGCAIVLFMDNAAPHGQFQVIEGIDHFLVQSNGAVSVMFIAFFAGILRLFAERAVGSERGLVGSLRDLMYSFVNPSRLPTESRTSTISGTPYNHRYDAWFAWLCLSLAVTFISTVMGTDLWSQTDSTGTNNSQSGDSKKLGELQELQEFRMFFIALLAVVYVAVGYFLWVYMVLFAKLTQEHHLSGRAARLFLGQLRLFRDLLPRQSVFIGPPHSGKTYFSGQLAIRHAQRSPDQILMYDGPTTGIDIRTGAISRERENNRTDTYQLTTLDTAGENMGDHLLLASLFRSDALVFILDKEMLDVEAMHDEQNFTLEQWHNLVVQSTMEAVRQTKIYLQGFHLATNRSDSSIISTDDLYRVKSFVLYLNQKPLNHYSQTGSQGKTNFDNVEMRLKNINASLGTNNDRWQNLAREIGRRFSVPQENSCCITGDGTAPSGIHLLAYSTSERRKLSHWPDASSETT